MPTILPARQARSRETLRRLLKAAADVLETDGLDGATVPRIAARAGVTPGAIYRRFPDKDALLRETCVRLLEENARQTRALLAPERWRDATLAAIAREVVASTVKSHARHRGLLRALALFTLQHPSIAFVRKCEALQNRVIRAVAELLLSRRREMRHPDPDFAVPFALVMIGVTTNGIQVLPRDPGRLSRLIPELHGRLPDELAQVVLRYLGIER
jgi:AcrR family transcriptional regulator